MRRNDLQEAYKLIFTGADPNCATGKDHAKTRKQYFVVLSLEEVLCCLLLLRLAINHCD